jgi:hypothetical protein
MISHKINISSIRTIITPVPYTPFTAIDEHGLLLGLSRQQLETNAHYKNRLSQIFSRRSNSTYNGLVYGITRDLGLDLFDAIFINPKLSSNNDWIAPDPYIEFDGIYVRLYSDYYNKTLDMELDRFEKGGHYEVYERLIQRINQSAYFTAGSYAGLDTFTSSMTIMNQSSRKEIAAEPIPISKKFKLSNERLCKYTVFFSDRNIFDNEVATTNLVLSYGDYHVDYITGIITTYSIPISGISVRYSYTIYPFQTIASPIILSETNNNNFKPAMFNQVLQDDGTYTNGTLNELGTDILNELLTVYPSYWGK